MQRTPAWSAVPASNATAFFTALSVTSVQRTRPEARLSATTPGRPGYDSSARLTSTTSPATIGGARWIAAGARHVHACRRGRRPLAGSAGGTGAAVEAVSVVAVAA